MRARINLIIEESILAKIDAIAGENQNGRRSSKGFA